MKVLHVTTSMDPKSGGPPQGLRNSIPNLVPFGFANEVLTCDAPDCAWLGTDAFPVHAVGPGRTPLRIAPKLGAWLDQNLNRFDGVIIHGLWLWSSICTTRAVARENARRDLMNAEGKTQNADGGHEAERKRPDGEGPQSLSPHQPLRCFVMPHGMLDPWFQRDKSRRLKAIRNWFYWWLVERTVVNSADAVFFTCQEELRLARTTFRGYQPRAEINVTYGVVEPPAPTLAMREAFVSHCPALGDRPYMLFLSRVHAKKGVDLLVRAYAQVVMERARSSKTRQASGQGHQLCDLPDLVIAGPGWDSKYGQQIRRQIEAANRAARAETGRLGARDGEVNSLDRHTGGQAAAATKFEDCERNTANSSACIHAVDMLAGDSKWGALYGCELFVLPSHQENFGIAVAEALACGRPVLISNRVNIWQEIVYDEAGWACKDTQLGTTAMVREFCNRWSADRGHHGQALGIVSSPSDDFPPHGSLFGDRPRECYLRRFAIRPAAARLGEVLTGFIDRPGQIGRIIRS